MANWIVVANCPNWKSFSDHPEVGMPSITIIGAVFGKFTSEKAARKKATSLTITNVFWRFKAEKAKR